MLHVYGESWPGRPRRPAWPPGHLQRLAVLPAGRPMGGSRGTLTTGTPRRSGCDASFDVSGVSVSWLYVQRLAGVLGGVLEPRTVGRAGWAPGGADRTAGMWPAEVTAPPPPPPRLGGPHDEPLSADRLLCQELARNSVLQMGIMLNGAYPNLQTGEIGLTRL